MRRLVEDIRERLDCEPARFFVHRHLRGKYVCAYCQTVLAAPLPAELIGEGISASGLMAQVITVHIESREPIRAAFTLPKVSCCSQ